MKTQTDPAPAPQAPPPPDLGTFRWLDPRDLEASKNPRRTPYPPERFAELVQSVRSRGILQPLNVRPLSPNGTTHYQVVTGDNRRKAAIVAGTEKVPCLVRELTDLDVLEIQLIENIQRQDMHPLDEGAAFAGLIASKQHTPESIASKVGKSIRWVYQRIEFTKLIPPAKEAFLEERITTSHAERLVRHTAAAQKQILENGMFERSLYGGNEQSLVTVDTLDDWILENVVLDVRTLPVIEQHLPEVAEAIKAATTETGKVLQVSTSHGTVPKGVLGPGAWKKATGQEKCKLSEAAVIVLGEGQGERVTICRNRTCAKHWPPRQDPATPPKAVSPKEAAAAARAQQKHERWAAQQRRQEEAQRRTEALMKAVRPKLIAHLAAIKVVPRELVQRALVKTFGHNWRELVKAMGAPVKDPERALALSLLVSNYTAPADFALIVKASKFDLSPFNAGLAKPAPAKPAKTTKTTKTAKKGKRR